LGRERKKKKRSAMQQVPSIYDLAKRPFRDRSIFGNDDDVYYVNNPKKKKKTKKKKKKEKLT
jgi:hypothetical protein